MFLLETVRCVNFGPVTYHSRSHHCYLHTRHNHYSACARPNTARYCNGTYPPHMSPLRRKQEAMTARTPYHLHSKSHKYYATIVEGQVVV